MLAQSVVVDHLIDLIVFGHFLPTENEDGVEAFSFSQLHFCYVMFRAVFALIYCFNKVDVVFIIC